jgi:RNA polymerase sigma factor (sigma-70 family)
MAAPEITVRASVEPATRPGLALWPQRIVELGALYRQAGAVEARDEALAELWRLVNFALARYARQHGRLRDLSEEDLLELTTAKALDLLRKLQAGSWDPSASKPAQVCAFLSTLAHRGIVDLLRSRPRARILPLTPQATTTLESEAPPPDVVAERHEFTRALSGCLGTFTPRARRVWLFRVCLELSSREIAGHPEVRMSIPAVDVTLARCRHRLRKCLRAKGQERSDLPPGTFVALWEALRRRGESPERG